MAGPEGQAVVCPGGHAGQISKTNQHAAGWYLYQGSQDGETDSTDLKVLSL